MRYPFNAAGVPREPAAKDIVPKCDACERTGQEYRQERVAGHQLTLCVDIVSCGIV